MDLNKFREELYIYGSDLSRWDSKLVTKAKLLLDNSEEARKVLAEVKALEQKLNEYQPASHSADLQKKILDSVTARPQQNSGGVVQFPGNWRVKFQYGFLGAIAASCVYLFIWLGASFNTPSPVIQTAHNEVAPLTQENGANTMAKMEATALAPNQTHEPVVADAPAEDDIASSGTVAVVDQKEIREVAPMVVYDNTQVGKCRLVNVEYINNGFHS